MNNNIGHPIAYGRTAEIYPWQNEQVLKLFYDWFSLEDIQYELRIAQAIQSIGLPVPHVGEIVQINGRTGLTYQRIDGIPMLEMMSRKPWNIFFYARRMAELHAQMHARTVQANIPTLHQKLVYKVTHAEALTSDLKSKTLVLLEKMPQGDRLCHGDFHPNNILLTKKREVIIDWIDSSLGNPLADLARTTIITLGAIKTGQIRKPIQRLVIAIFHSVYIHHYFSFHPGGEKEYSLWLPIVAAARLSENIPELEKWLIAQIENADKGEK